MRTILIFLVSLLSTSALWAYQPIRYSPLDEFVLKTSGKGPTALQVFDRSDKKTKSARMQYNKHGQLTNEIFYNASGEKEGEARIVYDQNRPMKEELYNASGKLLTSKVFTYQGQHLYEMRVLDAGGGLELQQKFVYKNGNLIGGSESNSTGQISFKIHYKENRPAVLEVRNDARIILSTIYYTYDSTGKLMERSRDQGGVKHKFVYSYKGNRISHYELLESTQDGWRKIKTVRYKY